MQIGRRNVPRAGLSGPDRMTLTEAGAHDGPRMKFRRILALLVCCVTSLPALAVPVGSKFFTNRDGLRLHYLEAGHGQKTVVLIPGWLMPAAVFRLQLEVLGDQFRVLAFDPRSQGQSDISTEPHDPVRRMADMEDFLRAAGVSDYVLAGWSLGVLESLDFIERKPQAGLRGLILIDNSIGEGTPPRPSARSSKRSSTNPREREQYLRDFSRGIFRTPPPDDIGEAVLRSALQVPVGAANQLIAQPYPRTYWREIVSRQQIPVLYAIRPRLREQGEALLASKGAQLAQVEVFEDAGHALFVDAAPRFNALTADFARRAFSLPANAARPAANGNQPSSGN